MIMRIFTCVCAFLTFLFFYQIYFSNLSHYSIRFQRIIDYTFHFIQLTSSDIIYHFLWSSFYQRLPSLFIIYHHLLNLKLTWIHAHLYRQLYNNTTLIKKHKKCYEFDKSTTTSIDTFTFWFYSRF